MARAYLGDTFRAMVRATCLAMLCCLHALADASPITDPTQGRAVFTGATSANPTSLDVNPAALGLRDVDELYFAATSVLNHIAIDRYTLDLDTGALGNGPDVSANLISPGGAAAYIWHPGRITLGIAAHSSPAERFIEDEDALRYHTLGGSYRTYALTVGTSFRVSSKFYLGVSLGIHTSFLHLRYARDTALAAGRDPARGVTSDCNGAPCGVENPAAEERYDVEARTDYVALENVVATIGIAVQLAQDTWLGIGYHAPPGLAIQNELTGTMTVERAPRDGGETVRGRSTVYLSQPASIDLELRTRILPALDLTVGSRLEDLSRLQAYDVRGYGSTFPRAGIPEWQLRPRGFRDVLEPFPFSVAAWAGVEQVEPSESPVILGGRIGFETSSIPEDRTSPLTIAPTSFTLDAGLQYRFTPTLALQVSYGAQFFPRVDVTDSAFDPRAQLTCEDSGYDYSTDACAAVRNGYAIPTAAGQYSRIEQSLRLALRVSL